MLNIAFKAILYVLAELRMLQEEKIKYFKSNAKCHSFKVSLEEQ